MMYQQQLDITYVFVYSSLIDISADIIMILLIKMENYDNLLINKSLYKSFIDLDIV